MRRMLLLLPRKISAAIAYSSPLSSLSNTKQTLFSLLIENKRAIVTSVSESECQDLDTSLIIEDTDFRRRSVDDSGSGLHVLDLVNRCSLHPDRKIYHTLLKRCTLLNKLYEGKIVHAHIINSMFRDDLVMQNTLVNMYAKCGDLGYARKLFDEMCSRDVVTWTVLITGYSQHDRPRDALVLFPEMLRVGVEPNQFTLASLLKAASGVGRSDIQGRQIHAFCLKYGYDSYVYVGSAILDMYARCGHLDEAHLIFDGLLCKNEVSWNALIAGYAREGEGEKAFRLFSNLLRENVKPTHFTYSSVLCACASIGSLEQGKWVHALVIKCGVKLVAFVGNTLLDMYAKSGNIEDAKKIFDRMVKRDIVSWNAMLTGYAQHGLGKIALKRFEEMLRISIAPNGITFLCVLTACSHAGLLDEGQWYFNLMKNYNIEPQISHYATMVDLLGRSGDLDRAKNFITAMPIEPTAAIWGALLGACRMHKNAELGAFAAERIFELDSQYPGTHILLYNIHASAGRWRDAAKVRRAMRESGVKKEPACSWVEIENEVHMFVADDGAHPQRAEIHKMWENTSDKIKEIGYVPDCSHVLLLMDQQEREVKLQYHSEKLALAFALLSTPPGSTIRIKKNIRVCGDCHSAFKFVSKLVDREIIVRDTKRFHHFHDGACSCGDYW